jgi:hypothetical protein
MNARKYSRTMAEAFGPYTSNELLPMAEPRRRIRQDWVLYLVSFVAVLAVLFF